MSTVIFETVKQEIRAASLEALPAILGQLEVAKVEAWTRLLTPPAPRAKPKEDERFLTPAAAAAIAQVSITRIYNWARGQPWAKRPSRRCLRIAEQSFRSWLQARL